MEYEILKLVGFKSLLNCCYLRQILEDLFASLSIFVSAYYICMNMSLCESIVYFAEADQFFGISSVEYLKVKSKLD